MMGKETILLTLWEHGIGETANRMIADQLYCCPTKAWIAGPFARAWDVFKSQLGMRYVHEESDCDNFVLGAHFFAQYLHQHTASKPKERALAFGEFWYRRAAGDGHAINFAVLPKQLVFFEPQTSQIVQLSDGEIASCVGFRL